MSFSIQQFISMEKKIKVTQVVNITKVWKWRNFILEWSIAFKRNESLPWEGFDMVRKPGWDISVSWEEKDSDPDVSCHATWTRKLNTHTRPLLSQFKYWIINNPGHTFKKKVTYWPRNILLLQNRFLDFLPICLSRWAAAWRPHILREDMHEKLQQIQ